MPPAPSNSNPQPPGGAIGPDASPVAPAAAPTLVAEAERSAGRKWLGFLLVLLLVLGVVYLSPLREYLEHLQRVKADLHRAGWLAPLVFAAGVTMLVTVGFPRLLFCAIGGMAFGFWRGLWWSQVGTIAGYYLVFLFVRWGGRNWVLRHFPKLPTWTRLVRRHGLPAVLLARQLPIPGLAVNLALGLAQVRHWHFLVGTAIGVLPEAIPCTLLGAGTLQTSFSRSAGTVIAAGLLLVLVWVGLRRYGRAPTTEHIEHGH